jgi:hypothetical protein
MAVHTAKKFFLICWEEGTLQVSYNYPLMALYGPYCLLPHPPTKKGTSYPSLGMRCESLSLKPCVPPLIPNSYRTYVLSATIKKKGSMYIHHWLLFLSDLTTLSNKCTCVFVELSHLWSANAINQSINVSDKL